MLCYLREERLGEIKGLPSALLPSWGRFCITELLLSSLVFFYISLPSSLLPVHRCQRDVQASRKTNHSKTCTKAECLSCLGAGWYPALGDLSLVMAFHGLFPAPWPAGCYSFYFLSENQTQTFLVPCGHFTVPESVQASFLCLEQYV